ncbi:aldo/keto reductase [uncultured Tateyamaria sp.]|uniref:aldo/keto reductase n=1 Tax=uncultured Tateyamaria sp. TaxID=455651 RepID=UPI0026164ABD|nr:aldo/keto reductase [uncultured Tateyamaria sp.]
MAWLHGTTFAMITSPNGTPLSPLTFGTMQFGGNADETASRAMFDAARNAGVTHFDTAYVYTGGASETLLGEMVQTERDDLIIATKAAYDGGSGRGNILTGFATSQKRLNLDVVDILYLHRFDDNTPLQETFDALATLKHEGRIRHIGVSNFAAWQVMKAQAVAAAFDIRIDIIQPMHSLVKRQSEVELFPMCVDQGIEIAPYSPLGGGLLTGKYSQGASGRLTEDSRYAARYNVAWMHEAAAKLAALADETGTSPATLAVAWAMAHPARPRPIVSARSAAQLAPSLEALNIEMTSDLYDRITGFSVTPPPATDRIEEA